jgi:exodeoxyribonuclease VII small subunit
MTPTNQKEETGATELTSKAAKADSFEKNLQRLDGIVHDLEDAELPLEKALELYEEGMKLTAICQQQLEEAEGRVEILRKRAGGKVVAEPFQEEEVKSPQG